MKIGFFITARLKSTRLKEKIILDLNGKTIIDHVIERCKCVDGISEKDIVLCTSGNPQDSKLYDYAIKNGIRFYIGSENDVLLRLGKAAEYYGFDYFLSITADNPLFSTEAANWIYEIIGDERPDFIFSKGLPIGCNLYALSTNCTKIVNHIKAEIDTEIWGPFVNQPSVFKVIELNIKKSPFNEAFRLTIDTPEDYELFKNIFSFYPNEYSPKTFDALKVLERESHLWEINSSIKQIFLSKEKIDSIEQKFKSSNDIIQNYIKENNIDLQPDYMKKVKKYY